jgi:hypothetical protein
MSKINKILLGAVIVLVVAIVAILGWWFFYRGSSNYYAVYLDTGDMYFGELSTFPNYSLSNVWYIQRDAQGNSSLAQFIKAPWGPEGTIQLNRDKVIWTAKISDVSQLTPYLENKIPETTSQQSGQPSTQSPPTTPPTSTSTPTVKQ